MRLFWYDIVFGIEKRSLHGIFSKTDWRMSNFEEDGVCCLFNSLFSYRSFFGLKSRPKNNVSPVATL